MDDQPRRSTLRADLRRRGLPPAYIERLVAELDDHFTDLVEERSSRMGAARKLQIDPQEAEQRLGEPTKLAVFAAEQYLARSFFGRHPRITFLMGPLPLLVACWLVMAVMFFAIDLAIAAADYVSTATFNWSLSSFAEENHPFLQAILLATMSWAAIVLPPLAAAWVLCRVAVRNGMHWKWPVIGCGVLASVVAMSMVSYKIKTLDAQGQWMMGFTFSTSVWWLTTTFLPRFALAMGIGLLLVKRSQQQANASESLAT